MLQLLENGLFALGQVLRFPVVVLLWTCVAASLFMVGRCFMEFVARSRERRGFDLTAWLRQGSALGADQRRVATLPVSLRSFLAEVETMRAASALGDGGLEHLVLEREEQARHGLTPSRALVKVGPSLGTMPPATERGFRLGGFAVPKDLTRADYRASWARMTTLLAAIPSIAELHLEANNRTWDTVTERGDDLGIFTEARPPYGCLGLTLTR